MLTMLFLPLELSCVIGAIGSTSYRTGGRLIQWAFVFCVLNVGSAALVGVSVAHLMQPGRQNPPENGDRMSINHSASLTTRVLINIVRGAPSPLLKTGCLPANLHPKLTGPPTTRRRSTCRQGLIRLPNKPMRQPNLQRTTIPTGMTSSIWTTLRCLKTEPNRETRNADVKAAGRARPGLLATGNKLEEGFAVLFAPTNSYSVASLSPSKLTEYVEYAAPGAVKEVRVNKARNLIEVEARTPKLKGVLLDLKALCPTPVRAFLPTLPNTCIVLIRNVELGLFDADIRNQIRAPVKTWDVRRLGEKSKLVKIVFFGKTRPDFLLYGLVRTPVLPFKVKALQCRRCVRYGHISAVCNRPKACARCGDSHDGGCESSEPKCINCRQSHEATSPSCPT
ncbi:hypothetical protein HPB47_015385 [Ixodes persulcatus]|uniref:Uncharacterized protein n=1 Tax=Ixodes persulcatus TaxID=34615 RepID=A0AC60R3G4_IXOPE|nr:hypothetical protein HPB47_015385 [Ixodes persulcatus]